MNPTLLIMAAGMGSRYGGLKQMDPLGPNGETLLEYSIFDALRAGFAKAVFVIRRDFERDFREAVGRRFEGRIDVRYAFQELDALPEGFSLPDGRTKPWGTGQAVLACREEIDEPFAVQNADDFYGAEAYRTIAEAFARPLPERGEGCMVGYRLRNTLSPHGAVSRGLCAVSPDGRLSGIVERTHVERGADGTIRCEAEGREIALTGEEICSMNFWGFAPSFFEGLEARFVDFLRKKGGEERSEWYVPEIVDDALREETLKIRVLESEARWFGVTYPEDRAGVVAALKALHDAGAYPAAGLWSDRSGGVGA